VGEHPLAAETAGINVYRIRYQAQMICGVLSGLGGVSLSIGQLSSFNENLVAGRGFIALAAIIFGQYRPIGAAIASIIFGLTDALQLRLQTYGSTSSPQLLLMMPYLITLIAFVLFIQRSAAPAASGKTYPEE